MAVSQEVVSAVTEIVRFIGYGAPLVAIIFLAKASTSLISGVANGGRRALRSLSKRQGKSVGQNVGQKISLATRSGKIRLARSDNAFLRKTGISSAAGFGLRSKAKQKSREGMLGEAESNYVDVRTATDPKFAKQSAGVMGSQGTTRVQADAQARLQKVEDEKLANSVTLLSNKLRDLGGIDAKALASGLKGYLDSPNDPAKQIIAGFKGGFDLKDLTQDPGLMKAALHMSAGAGEVMTIRQARMSNQLDQRMVDDVILKNAGTLKEKGGFDLATERNLAYGRNGALTSFVDTASDQTQSAAVRDAAKGEAKRVMAQSTLNTVAQSSAEDLSKMKAGVVASVAQSIQMGMVPAKIEWQQNLSNILDDAAKLPSVKARLSQNRILIEDATRTYINPVANPPKPFDPKLL